jgi:hypothetical protein
MIPFLVSTKNQVKQSVVPSQFPKKSENWACVSVFSSFLRESGCWEFSPDHVILSWGRDDGESVTPAFLLAFMWLVLCLLVVMQKSLSWFVGFSQTELVSPEVKR